MKIKLLSPQRINLTGKKAIFLPYFSKEAVKINDQQIRRDIEKISKFSKSLDEGEARLIFSGSRRFLFLNLGKKEKWNQRRFLLSLRKAIRILKENKIGQAVLFLDGIIPPNANLVSLTRQISENILMADYEFDKYKNKSREGWSQLELVEIIWPDSQRYQKDLSQGEIIGRAVNFVRDLSNTPGGEMTPDKLAKISATSVRKLGNIKVEIFDEKKLKRLKMNGILGMSQGSSQKPRLVILKYFGRKKDKKIDLVFVGKGVTFDSGGLNIKPADSMMQDMMYMDMSGGAAVLGAVRAIRELKLPLNIVSLIPAVENMPSGSAVRPGDVLKLYNGKTVEIGHTDAEGRVIMADALSYAAKNFRPKMMIDLATLTGSALQALGQEIICLLSNSDKLENILRQIGNDSGDYAWPLPLWEEYERDIKGNIADISNTSRTKYGGAITAALFLNNFTGGLPWVHLDIASTMISTEGQGLTKGATGTGVRYLVELARNFPKIKNHL